MDQFINLRTNDNIADVLKHRKAKFIDVVIELSLAQFQFIMEAPERSEKIYTQYVAPSIDNMLGATTDLIKATLTIRLLGETKEVYISKLHEFI
ncbi:hypothetical protein [Trichormus azollae]|jgi:hypothetical protein|uniref:hypothetical protein n=1 Tax=Trichormus azollae TaxID=1164 RepID=UPI0001956D0A|nr:hypothetical protein [Trichormus azollae]